MIQFDLRIFFSWVAQPPPSVSLPKLRWFQDVFAVEVNGSIVNSAVNTTVKAAFFCGCGPEVAQMLAGEM